VTQPLLSVVVCTHNPREDYIARTMTGLRAQTLPTSAWELVVIDNLSAAPLADRLDLGWHPAARLVREEKLGLTPARLRGIREARGDLLVFVDDDNVLDPDYLAVARRTADEKPFLGSWSGQCRPGFDAPPPEWTRRYWGNLALREFDDDAWSNQPRLAATMPCGAGLCIRRQVAERYLALHEAGGRRFQFDRTGSSLISGGDNDLAACACLEGLGVGVIAALKLQHLMPADRFTADYLTRLAEGIHFSSTLLDAQWGLPTPPPSRLRRLADRVRRVLLPSPHRQIFAAALRGRDKALDLLSSGSAS
jgi:glycosyltransferase involved in cell wall biosynthesis